MSASAENGQAKPLSPSEGGINRRELFTMLVPGETGALKSESRGSGQVKLEATRCTGCGLCAADCTTGALELASGTEGVYRVLFRQELCTACGRCVAACPEKCLTVDAVSEAVASEVPPAALFEDTVARCRECGRVLGPRATIERLRARLEASKLPTSHVDLCPMCKVGRLSLGRVRARPGNSSGR